MLAGRKSPTPSAVSGPRRANSELGDRRMGWTFLTNNRMRCPHENIHSNKSKKQPLPTQSRFPQTPNFHALGYPLIGFCGFLPQIVAGAQPKEDPARAYEKGVLRSFEWRDECRWLEVLLESVWSYSVSSTDLLPGSGRECSRRKTRTLGLLRDRLNDAAHDQASSCKGIPLLCRSSLP